MFKLELILGLIVGLMLMAGSVSAGTVTYSNSNRNLYHLYTDNGGSFSANYVGNTNFDYFPNDAAINDAIYFANSYVPKFSSLKFYVGTAFNATSVTFDWEYYNGSWVPLTVNDRTSNFSNLGTNWIYFDVPSDWTTVTINAVNNYWVRCRISAIDTPIEGGAQSTKTIKYDSQTLKVSGYVSGSPCDCDELYTADTEAIDGRWLLDNTIDANPDAFSLDRQPFPADSFAVPLKITCTARAGATCNISGTDAWGNVLTENGIDISSGSVNTTKEFRAVDVNGIIVSGMINGDDFDIKQDRYGVFYKQEKNYFCEAHLEFAADNYFVDSGITLQLGTSTNKLDLDTKTGAYFELKSFSFTHYIQKWPNWQNGEMVFENGFLYLRHTGYIFKYKATLKNLYIDTTSSDLTFYYTLVSGDVDNVIFDGFSIGIRATFPLNKLTVKDATYGIVVYYYPVHPVAKNVILIDNTHDIRMYHCSHPVGPSSITMLDSVFDKNKLLFGCADNYLLEKYSFDLKVTDKDGNIIPNATVSLKDQYDNLVSYLDSEANLAEILDKTETGVDVTDGTKFTVNDIILIDGEYMQVTNIAGNTLTVTRNYYGANYFANIHPNSKDIFIIQTLTTDVNGETATMMGYRGRFDGTSETETSYSPLTMEINANDSDGVAYNEYETQFDITAKTDWTLAIVHPCDPDPDYAYALNYPMSYDNVTNTITVWGNSSGSYPMGYDSAHAIGFDEVWEFARATKGTCIMGDKYIFKAFLQIGDGTIATYFADTKKSVVFEDLGASSKEIRVMNNAHFQSGTLLDEGRKSTVNGCTFHFQETGAMDYGIYGESGSDIYLYSTHLSTDATVYTGITGIDKIYNTYFDKVYLRVSDVTMYNVVFMGGYFAMYAATGTWDKIIIRDYSNSGITVATNHHLANVDQAGCGGIRAYVVTTDSSMTDCDIDTWHFSWTSCTADIYRKYSLDLKVIDKYQDAIDGAKVEIWDKDDNLVTDTTTYANGSISTATLNYGYYNVTGGDNAYMQTPHKIKISHQDYPTRQFQFNITEKTDWTIALKDRPDSEGYMTVFGTEYCESDLGEARAFIIYGNSTPADSATVSIKLWNGTWDTMTLVENGMYQFNFTAPAYSSGGKNVYFFYVNSTSPTAWGTGEFIVKNCSYSGGGSSLSSSQNETISTTKTSVNIILDNQQKENDRGFTGTLTAIFIFIFGIIFFFISYYREEGIIWPFLSVVMFLITVLYSYSIPFSVDASGAIIVTSTNVVLSGVSLIFVCIALLRVVYLSFCFFKR